MARYDVFDLFNHAFDNMDTLFYPKVKSYCSEQRSITEGGVTTHYHNGMVSRLDGPAVVYQDEREDEYWVDGRRVSKEVHDKLRQDHEDKKEHIIYIDGQQKKVNGKKLREIKQLLE